MDDRTLTDLVEARVITIMKCLYVIWKTEVVHTAFAEGICFIVEPEIYKYNF